MSHDLVVLGLRQYLNIEFTASFRVYVFLNLWTFLREKPKFGLLTVLSYAEDCHHSFLGKLRSKVSRIGLLKSHIVQAACRFLLSNYVR